MSQGTACPAFQLKTKFLARSPCVISSVSSLFLDVIAICGLVLHFFFHLFHFSGFFLLEKAL